METSKSQSHGRGGNGRNNNSSANVGGQNRHDSGNRGPFSGSSSGSRGNRNYHYQRDNKQFNKKKIKDRTDHNGIPMNASQEECILCCQNSDIFGLGTCRHPACMECVIRMRCQGKSNTCHACRDPVPIMFFVNRPPDVDWSTLQIPNCAIPHPDLRKHDIAFEDLHVADCYDKLIANSCVVCSKRGQFAEFPTFVALKQHIGTHQLFYCHICEENLNLLPKDREIYTSNELKSHISTHHPICRFCNERYYDEEALFMHSRKNHFFCTLCAQETGANTFFSRIDQVHRHYKTAHHPCLDPNCVSLGIVFRNEVDLNAHKIEQHGGTDRNVQIDFQFSRNTSRYTSPPRRLADHTSSGISVVPSSHPPREAPINIIPSAQFSGQPVILVPPPTVRQADFPSLAPSSASNHFGAGSNWRSDVQAARSRAAPNAEPPVQQQLGSNSHFPTLGPSNPSSSGVSTVGVWGQGKLNKIKQPPKPPVEKKKVEPEVPRKRIIPLPQVWPESMRRKLEARELGLPEPPDEFPALPITSKKKKEPKKKTVNPESLQKRFDEKHSAPNNSTTSKFDALAVVGSPIDDSTVEAWLSSTAMKAKQKKANQKKAEKMAKDEEKRKLAEEEELKHQQRLTHEKFLAELAEANRKEREEKEQKEADLKYLEEHADENHPSDTKDPMLELLMQQFEAHSTSVRSETERQNARIESRLGQNFNNDKQRPSATTIQREHPIADEPTSSKSSNPPNNHAVMPPPGFENLDLAPPPGLQMPPGLG
ncbi:RING-type domain-containing protein [Aphelenchoides besseyi]|nr:RING-type domain-containing protein [Aphelenchoides besseyi]